MASGERPRVLLTTTDRAYVECPSCKQKGWLDADQIAGRVSIDCATAGCSYHETVDLTAPVAALRSRQRVRS